MSYEVFTRKVQRAGSPAMVFTKIGQLRFNQAATKALQKETIEHVLLMWDASHRKFALKVTNNKKDPRAYRIHYASNNNGAGFSAKTFMDHVGLDSGESHTIEIDINPNSEYLIEVELSEAWFKKKAPRIIERGKATA